MRRPDFDDLLCLAFLVILGVMILSLCALIWYAIVSGAPLS